MTTNVNKCQQIAIKGRCKSLPFAGGKNDRRGFNYTNNLRNIGGDFNIWRRKKEMTRVEENNAAILYITQVLENGPSPMRMEGLKVAALADISKSLAIIADAMTEKRKEKQNGTQ